MSDNPGTTPVVDDSAAETTHAVLVQAPVLPLDASGFTASVVGTVLVAAILIASMRWHFADTWSSVLFAALGCGLVLICYTAWHRNRALARSLKHHAQGPAPDHTQPDHTQP